MAPKFHDLTVAAIRAEAADAVAVTFATPGSGDYAFRPGQYLTLRADIGGEDIRRSYSIASRPGEPLCVGIKQVEGGAFSTFAQGLRAGDTIRVMEPEGRFCLSDEQDILLIAAGSGITPMISIASEALARGASVTLVYGNRSYASIMFRQALDDLKDRYLERFTMIHVLSREGQDIPLLEGRVDGDRIGRLAQAGAIAPLAAEGVFLCGPGEMIDEVSAALKALGVPDERIHHERFTQDGEAPRAPRSAAAEAAAAAGVAVEVILDGARRSFRVEEGDDNVVDAAHRAGLELPFSCKGGMCCTCRCRVVEGSAEMAVNYSLENWELEAGFTLACQSRPTSEKLVLDFDAA